MPQISDKGREMPSSPIRKLVPYAETAKASGKTIYHLNIGQPDIVTPPVMLQAVKNSSMKILAYSHSAGNESYRKKLTHYYAKVGIQLSHDNILVTTGGSEAILFTLLSCLNAGDEVIIPEPFYANYNGFSAIAGINVKPVTSYLANGFQLPDAANFELQITPKTKAILICNPNNPSGSLYSLDELQQLRKLALKHDLFLIADEVYREFVYDNSKHHSILSLPDLEQHAIVVDSISKRYSACGARIGALVTRNMEVINTALKFAQARLSPPSFAQIAAEAALDLPDDYFAETSAEYTRRRNVLVAGLNHIEGVECPMPKGAFYVIARLPISSSDHFCQWLLEEFDYQGETLMLAPATGFYKSDGLGKNEVRMAYVLAVPQLKKALKCLEMALKEYDA